VHLDLAAEREHIAPSAVSKRKEVKVDLFRRHRTGLQPTPAGHALLHHARMLMRDLAQLESELGDYAQGLLPAIVRAAIHAPRESDAAAHPRTVARRK
jgi:DNA-binding transcriptional LysR family regulator